MAWTVDCPHCRIPLDFVGLDRIVCHTTHCPAQGKVYLVKFVETDEHVKTTQEIYDRLKEDVWSLNKYPITFTDADRIYAHSLGVSL